MDIKTNNTLDMAINKDDLIDIMIDNQLTVLEAELKDLVDERTKITQEIDDNSDIVKKSFDADLCQAHLPKEIKTKEVPHLHYYANSSCTVRFQFKNFEVSINNVNAINLSPLAKEIKKQNEKLHDKVRKLKEDINKIENEINTITKSPKRLKAKMLKTFLGASTEGKQVLSLINNSLTTRQLLAPDTTSKKSK